MQPNFARMWWTAISIFMVLCFILSVRLWQKTYKLIVEDGANKFPYFFIVKNSRSGFEYSNNKQ